MMLALHIVESISAVALLALLIALWRNIVRMDKRMAASSAITLSALSALVDASPHQTISNLIELNRDHVQVTRQMCEKIVEASADMRNESKRMHDRLDALQKQLTELSVVRDKL